MYSPSQKTMNVMITQPHANLGDAKNIYRSVSHLCDFSLAVSVCKLHYNTPKFTQFKYLQRLIKTKFFEM